MPARGPNLRKILVQHHVNRVLSGTNDPSGLQWFVEVSFDEEYWYRDRGRVSLLVDTLASASWFREFNVFAPAHQVGTPFHRIDDVRDLIANNDADVAIFAHGEPRMTVDTHEADAAMALSFTPKSLELRAWFSAVEVDRYKGAIIGDMTSILVALRKAWPRAVVTRAVAFPRPFDGVRYKRTRPLRMASRPLGAVADVFDRDCQLDTETIAPNSVAIIDAPVPPQVRRTEEGRLVANVWTSDPSNPAELADACSRHEQWAVPLMRTQLAPGWNMAGDLEVVEDLQLIDVTSSTALPAKGRKGQAVVVSTREMAKELRDRAVSSGFPRLFYRDSAGKLWDPFPPGDWVEANDEEG